MKMFPDRSARARLIVACLLLAAASLLVLSTPVRAAETANRYRIGDVSAAKSTGGPYRLDTYTIDNGGGVSSDVRYRLQGSIGQSDAQPAASDARYRLQGGFWPAVIPPEVLIFRSGFESP
jgi:hypothetical protein